VNKAVVVMPGPDIVTVVEWTTTGEPETFNISLNNNKLLCESFPNPFSEKTRISFSIPEDGNVELSVVDKNGLLIKKLIDKHMKKGDYQVLWDATNFPTGLYFCNLRHNNKVKSCKMVVAY